MNNKWSKVVSKRSLEKNIDFQTLWAGKNLGQFETVILNGTPCFGLTSYFQNAKSIGLLLPHRIPH
jgi:hypothetical protein